MIKIMTVNEFISKLKNDEILIVDVRELAEYQEMHIEGAVLIPLGELSLSRLPKSSKPIVIYCRSGKRSEEACKRLLLQDPSLDVCHLQGGILAFMKEI